MAKKSIVFFTVGYPYGKGEAFLEQEMKLAEDRFNKILIVSCVKKSGTVDHYVPQNASLLSIRDNVSKFSLSMLRLFAFFRLRNWKQLILCIKERGIKSWYSGIISVVLESSLISLLIKNEKNWIDNYDLYYSYWLSGSASYLALRKKYLSGMLISRAHGYDCFFERGFHPFRKEQFENLDYIFPISSAGKEDLIQQGCNAEKINVSRLGVNNTYKELNPHLLSNKKTIVSCSNIVELKRLDLLIESLSLIDSISIEWIHFGDGEMKDKIEKLASDRLSTKANISYSFKGSVPVSSIYDFYAKSSVDLFINCSDVEGIPVSIMEAMSFGIPCIARDVGGNREIVDNNSNGILLSRNITIQELRDSIVDLLCLDSDKYEILSKNAFKKYTDCYDAGHNFSKYWDSILEMESKISK